MHRTDIETTSLLRTDQVSALRTSLGGRTSVLCFGGGVDSTAMLVALREAALAPELILMADTGGEKPETWQHVERMQRLLADWQWPSITICKKTTQAETGYTDLEGNCVTNETLPSLAFGMKSCSLKWKAAPQDAFIKGVRRGPNACPPHPIWQRAQARGERIVKLIGYDSGRADRRRAGAIASSDVDFDYAYPLQLIGWTRADCADAITRSLGAEYVPIKSACFFLCAHEVSHLIVSACFGKTIAVYGLRYFQLRDRKDVTVVIRSRDPCLANHHGAHGR